MKSKPTAHIEDWYYEKSANVLIGKVKNHPNQHQFSPDGFQQTSKVLKLDKENNLAETKNTIYTLGKPY